MNPLTVQLDIGGMWHTEIFWIIFAITVFMTVMKSPGVAPTLFWSYVLVSALYTLEYPALPFGGYNTAYQAMSGQTFAEALLIPLFLIMRTYDDRKFLIELFQFVIWFEIAMVWLHRPGLLIAPSFDTAFIAMYLPYANPWLWIASIGTIINHHGSTAIMIGLAQLLVWAWRHDRRWLFLIPIALLLIYENHNYFMYESSFMQGSGERFEKYHKYMGFWLDQDLKIKLLGVGAGSFMWCAMLIDKFKNPLYLAMHSDILQMIFELGVVGVGLGIGTVATAVYRARTSEQSLMAIMGSLAFFATYHPLRFAPTAVFIALVYAQALFPDTDTRYSHL